jgi:hypothetical protein
VNTVTLTPTTQTLAAGSTQQLVATLRDANNNVLANRPITWQPSGAEGGASTGPNSAASGPSGMVTPAPSRSASRADHSDAGVVGSICV